MASSIQIDERIQNLRHKKVVGILDAQRPGNGNKYVRDMLQKQAKFDPLWPKTAFGGLLVQLHFLHDSRELRQWWLTLAVFSGSLSSAGAGVRAVLTAQKRQPRVHVSPVQTSPHNSWSTIHHNELCKQAVNLFLAFENLA